MGADKKASASMTLCCGVCCGTGSFERKRASPKREAQRAALLCGDLSAPLLPGAQEACPVAKTSEMVDRRPGTPRPGHFVGAYPVLQPGCLSH